MYTKTANKFYEIDTLQDRFRIYQNVHGAITTIMELDANNKLNINGKAETSKILCPTEITGFSIMSGMAVYADWLHNYLKAGPVYLMIVNTKTLLGISYYTLRFTSMNSPYFETNLLCGKDVINLSFDSGNHYLFKKLLSDQSEKTYDISFYKFFEI